MKKLLILFTALIGTAINVHAQAEHRQFVPCPAHSCIPMEIFQEARPYVSGFAGANFLKYSKGHAHAHPGYGIGIALGSRFQTFRGELEVSFRRNELKNIHGSYEGNKVRVPLSGHVETLAVMVNGYYDFSIDSCFTPYVGAGCGYAMNKAQAHLKSTPQSGSWKERSDKFAWQVIAGVSMPVSEMIDLGIEYRYVKPHSKVHDQNINLSARYSF